MNKALKELATGFVSAFVWFGLFSFIAWATQAEWMDSGKYWMTGIVMSFFIGVRVGLYFVLAQVRKGR